MLDEQTLSTATAVEKTMYRALTELEELTQELAQAVDRRDQVTIRMFLSLRREQLNILNRQKTILRRQCAQLSPEDGELLRRLLWEKEPPACDGSQELVEQAARNRSLLERLIQADARASRRLGGAGSFYEKK